MPSIAILGATGSLGRNLAVEFARRGTPFVALSRSREKLDRIFAGNPQATLATDSLEGIETAIYAIGVPHDQFHLHPALIQSAIDRCRSAGVRNLIVISSVYSYGKPRTPRVAEDHPREPETRKGKIRKEQEDIALAATGMQTLVLRLPEFYGPYAEHSMATPVINAAFRNMAAPWIGPVDAPREFIYLPDAARTIADVAGRGDLYGRAWNAGGAGTITAREFVEHVYAEVGAKPRIRNAGKFLVRVAGMFSGLIKDVYEMYYLQQTPVILDDSALHSRMEIAKTPYVQGIAATIDWLRRGGATPLH